MSHEAGKVAAFAPVGHLPALVTAAGTMVWASVVLVPVALAVDQPWLLRPSASALASVAVLSVLGTGVALLIYFRLLQRLGSMGVASQAYLRAAVGVLLGMVFLGESFTVSIGAGLLAAAVGVALINIPTRSQTARQASATPAGRRTRGQRL